MGSQCVLQKNPHLLKPYIHYHCWRIWLLPPFCVPNLTRMHLIDAQFWRQGSWGNVAPRLPVPMTKEKAKQQLEENGKTESKAPHRPEYPFLMFGPQQTLQPHLPDSLCPSLTEHLALCWDAAQLMLFSLPRRHFVLAGCTVPMLPQHHTLVSYFVPIIPINWLVYPPHRLEFLKVKVGISVCVCSSVPFL